MKGVIKLARIRELQLSDMDYMYEWMSDTDVMGSLVLGRTINSKGKIEDFIRASWNDKTNIHFAIVTDENEYVGTVSLKNINYIDRNAEYAIAIRKEFWGKGFSKIATDELLKFGFYKLNMHKIFLNVISKNIRANKFYCKFGFELEGVLKEHLYLNGEYVDLNLYRYLRRSMDNNKGAFL